MAQWELGGERHGSLPLPRTWDGPIEQGDASAYADRTLAVFGESPTVPAGGQE